MRNINPARSLAHHYLTAYAHNDDEDPAIDKALSGRIDNQMLLCVALLVVLYSADTFESVCVYAMDTSTEGFL